MRTTPLLAAAAALFLARAATAQAPAHATLRLHVDDERGHPLQHAVVRVGGVTRPALTDSHGDAVVDLIPPGNRIVEVSHVGYALLRVPADFDSVAVARRVRMTADPVELPGITVTSWGRSMRLRNVGFYERQRQGMGDYMTGDELMATLPLNTSDAFRRMRGFTLAPTRGSDFVVVTTRGMANLSGNVGYCYPLLYIDGMLMSTRTQRDQVEAFRSISPDDVEGIEAYPSPATIPAQYNITGSACGVVLIWTKSGENSARK
jgi:hypothetical protein